MSSFLSRRNFIVGGLTTSIACATGKNTTTKIDRSKASPILGRQGFPLVCTSVREQITAELSLVSTVARTLELDRDISCKNRFHLDYYAPSGKNIWSETRSVAVLSSDRLKLPPDLGWGALTVSFNENHPLLITGRRSPHGPTTSFLHTETPYGSDSHHSLEAHGGMFSFHVLRPPKARGEGSIISFFNPFSLTVAAHLLLYGRSGKVLFKREVVFNPFEQFHMGLGKVRHGPEKLFHLEALEALEGSDALLIKTVVGNDHLGLMVSSWSFNEDLNSGPYLLKTHGIYTPQKEMQNLREEKNLSGLCNLKVNYGIFPILFHYDFIASKVTLGEGPFAQDSRWSTTLLIPNLSDQDILYFPLVTDSKGTIVLGPNKKWFSEFGRYGGPDFRILPNEVKSLSLDDFIERGCLQFNHGGLQEQGGIYGLFCYLGLNNPTMQRSILKCYFTKEDRVFSVTHGHKLEKTLYPNASISNLAKPSLAHLGSASSLVPSLKGYVSDYFVLVPNDSSEKIISLHNHSDSETSRAFLQCISRNGIHKSNLVAPIAAGGIKNVSLSSLQFPDLPHMIRLVSETHLIRLHLFGKGKQLAMGQSNGKERSWWYSIHSTRRF